MESSSKGSSSKATSAARFRNIIALTCVAASSCSVAFFSLNDASLGKNSNKADSNEAFDRNFPDGQVRVPSIAGLGTNGRFHQSGLGGILNINHPAGARARRKLSESNVIIPTSAVKHAIPSLGKENIENLHGHYVHDEHRSPFASFLYNRTKEELDAEQEDYVQRMSKIRDEWGAWDFNDEHPEIRPIANFDKTPYKDLKNTDFPEKAWQMDQKYVTDFIGEARKLVDRVREGIYAEYGHPSKGLNEDEIAARNELFKIHITDDSKPPKVTDGWAFMNKKGLEMYAKKLLHSMMANDEFYYIMGGHSAAAGHGNNFHQTYMMEFANIMEPVMHKLGVRLITRNLAMGGLGTTHYSLGASTLYGETDVMYWDSGMTEKSAEDQDLFHKQVLLGGERVPVLLNGAVNNLDVETGDNLWYGNYIETWTAVEKTSSLDQGETLPWAIQYLLCEGDVGELCNGRGGVPKYHDSCWIDRSDFVPTTRQNQNGVAGKAGWHPGDRPHKYQARKQTMLMLKALDEALNLWEMGIESDGFPLHEKYWHVGDIYTDVRSKLSNYITNDGFNTTACEKRWGTNPTVEGMGLDRACRIALKGMSEFYPINRGHENSILKHMKTAPNGYKPKRVEGLYEGVDVLPPFWKVPEGHVDVHAIALASTHAPSELDHSWVDENGDEDAEEAENSRRMLRTAATERIAVNVHDAALDSTAIEAVGDERHLSGDEVVPGQGWNLVEVGGEEITGYCDGSPMCSDCKRSKNRNCLLSNQNDARTQLAGDGLSGWLVVTVPDVKEGLIFARIQWWSPRNMPFTKDWTEVNNGIKYGEDGNRLLGGKVTDWPDDFEIDIAVNGKIIKTYGYEEFKAKIGEIAYNESFYPLMDDKDVTGDVEIGVRIRSEKDPHIAAIAFTHIYWA